MWVVMAHGVGHPGAGCGVVELGVGCSGAGCGLSWRMVWVILELGVGLWSWVWVVKELDVGCSGAGCGKCSKQSAGHKTLRLSAVVGCLRPLESCPSFLGGLQAVHSQAGSSGVCPACISVL